MRSKLNPTHRVSYLILSYPRNVPRLFAVYETVLRKATIMKDQTTMKDVGPTSGTINMFFSRNGIIKQK